MTSLQTRSIPAAPHWLRHLPQCRAPVGSTSWHHQLPAALCPGNTGMAQIGLLPLAVLILLLASFLPAADTAADLRPAQLRPRYPGVQRRAPLIGRRGCFAVWNVYELQPVLFKALSFESSSSSSSNSCRHYCPCRTVHPIKLGENWLTLRGVIVRSP